MCVKYYVFVYSDLKPKTDVWKYTIKNVLFQHCLKRQEKTQRKQIVKLLFSFFVAQGGGGGGGGGVNIERRKKGVFTPSPPP